MSVDRPEKRKTIAKRDAVSPNPPANKKRPKSRTADNLEALLHLVDEDETSRAALAAERTPRKIASGRTPRPAWEKPPSSGEASSFMQELARARADLHKERCRRIALEEEVESLRSELTRLATTGTAEVAELRRESEGLQERMAALERQRQKLKDALFDAEAELDEEQQQRDLLNDQVDALHQRLAEIEPGPGAS